MSQLTDEERWRRREHSDWREFCNRLVALATTCRELGGEIRIAAALAIASVDGYPSSTAGAGDPGRGSGADALPYGDPTGNAAATEPEIVIVDRLLREYLSIALDALEAADRNAVRGRRLLTPPQPPDKARAPECVNCARFEIYSAAVKGKAGRCVECFDYRAKYHRDAPEKVVRERLANATPRQVARGAAIPPESAAWISRHLTPQNSP